ncbi:MAG: LuxR C-terminal-related transcriptional regulator [Solirubrobacteraceae bacterium]
MLSAPDTSSGPPDRGPSHLVLGSVFEESRIPMALVDRNRCYLRINGAALRLFRYQAEDVIGSRAARTARDIDPITGDEQWNQLLSDNQVYGQRVLEHSSGTPIRISFAAHTTSLDGQWAALVVVLSAHLEPTGVELIRTAEPDTSSAIGAKLTPREREIIRRVALGHSTKQIADDIYLSRHTVRTHIRNAMIKTGAHTSAQLVSIALTHGLIDD